MLRKKQLGKAHWVILVLMGLFAIAIAFVVARSQDYMVNGDFFELWLAGRLIWSPINIYDTPGWMSEHIRYGNQWDFNLVFPYPPVVAFLMAPLGLLPLKIASIVWILLSLGLVLTSTLQLLSLSGMYPRLSYLIPVLAGVLLFRPVLVTLYSGQLGAVLLLFATLATWSWTRRYWFTGGVALSFLILRPTLGFPLIGLAALWVIYKKRWDALAGIIASIAAMTIVSWIRYPNWLGEWLELGDQKLVNTFGYHPNVWGLAGAMCAHNFTCTMATGSLLTVVSIAAVIPSLSRLPSEDDSIIFLAFVIPVALLATPYMWVYDQILLVIPILIIVIKFFRMGWSYLLTATFPLLMAYLALAMLMTSMKVGIDVPGVLLSILSFTLMFFWLLPDRPGLSEWQVTESEGKTGET